MEELETLIERLLAALVLTLVAAAYGMESRSVLAERIRTLQPFVAWTAVQAPGQDLPLFFLSLHQPAKPVLDVIHVPDATIIDARETLAGYYRNHRPNSLESRKAAQAAAARLHERIFSLPSLHRLDLGAPRFQYVESRDFPAGDPAVAMAVELRRSSSGLRFWKGLPALLRNPGADALLSPGTAEPPTLLDRLALALECHRLPRRALRPAWLPEGPSPEAFLLRLLGPSRETADQPERPIAVEVFNATQTKGIASRATKVLRLKGADVTFFGNTEEPGRGTLVYDRTGRFERALRVRDMLDCPSAEAVTRVRERTLADVSVFVGEDCGSRDGRNDDH